MSHYYENSLNYKFLDKNFVINEELGMYYPIRKTSDFLLPVPCQARWMREILKIIAWNFPTKKRVSV